MWLADKRWSAHFGDAKSGDVLAVGSGAIPGSPQRCQDASDGLHGDPPINGVVGRRRCARQASAGVVVADGLHGGRQDARHHTQDRGQTHRWRPPLTCGRQIPNTEHSTLVLTRKKAAGPSLWPSQCVLPAKYVRIYRSCQQMLEIKPHITYLTYFPYRFFLECYFSSTNKINQNNMYCKTHVFDLGPSALPQHAWNRVKKKIAWNMSYHHILSL